MTCPTCGSEKAEVRLNRVLYREGPRGGVPPQSTHGSVEPCDNEAFHGAKARKLAALAGVAGMLPDEPEKPPSDSLRESGPCACDFEFTTDHVTYRQIVSCSFHTNAIAQARREGAMEGRTSGWLMAFDLVRTYHRAGHEINETWLHKQIRNAKGKPDADQTGQVTPETRLLRG